MAIIKPFAAVRPTDKEVKNVAALPYDVVNREEAKEIVKNQPNSFLKIDRAEVQLESSVSTYDQQVYLRARDTLNEMINEGIFIREDKKVFYLYQLTMDGRKQTGLVACSSIDDYINNVIKKHEKTREAKEQDRINHVDYCNAQTGPIFLAYRSNDTIKNIVDEVKEANKPIYDFVADDNIGHTVWIINEDEKIEAIEKAFVAIENTYIADGHHRTASAVKVGLKRREENPGYNGSEMFNYFLSVIFPQDELMILPYNRVVRDLNGNDEGSLIEEISKSFEVELIGEEPFQPTEKETFGMFLNDNWYKLTIDKALVDNEDPVKKLDVSLLQDYLLDPILNIKDPRVDDRIDFVGGIRGLKELEKRATSDMKVAFSMYPTSIEELFEVSDADKLMPPKSTWFEPKLRSGIFINTIDK
ncbi:uncharacterized protein (DUF1015 family) [Natranaerovirga pectinivora]|uniref:Uncharacterized protein (DUF1015 family) n=1 Tax=Natranaerovirga pectinivora TaxID=682400 RepID=A0A4R3MSC8_9FIRM|nr:DUF1015 family protein [Natranaerovirga pectinivora]TCT16338.1 uncharacterized protein (DUF1015 family) [Natranaerovirga pectinivora]